MYYLHFLSYLTTKNTTQSQVNKKYFILTSITQIYSASLVFY